MGHHRRAEVADWSMAKVNDIELMFCIQTHALDIGEGTSGLPKGYGLLSVSTS